MLFIRHFTDVSILPVRENKSSNQKHQKDIFLNESHYFRKLKKDSLEGGVKPPTLWLTVIIKNFIEVAWQPRVTRFKL